METAIEQKKYVNKYLQILSAMNLVLKNEF